jgi:hypothetical protein
MYLVLIFSGRLSSVGVNPVVISISYYHLIKEGFKLFGFLTSNLKVVPSGYVLSLNL